MDDVRIRWAELVDAESVFGLLTQFATSYGPARAVFEQSYPRLLAATASNGVEFLVAESEDTVVAFALTLRFLTLYANGPIVELQELMVAPRARGRGIGAGLVRAVIDRARAGGAR